MDREHGGANIFCIISAIESNSYNTPAGAQGDVTEFSFHLKKKNIWYYCVKFGCIFMSEMYLYYGYGLSICHRM
jgi:hypothetical protein